MTSHRNEAVPQTATDAQRVASESLEQAQDARVRTVERTTMPLWLAGVGALGFGVACAGILMRSWPLGIVGGIALAAVFAASMRPRWRPGTIRDSQAGWVNLALFALFYVPTFTLLWVLPHRWWAGLTEGLVATVLAFGYFVASDRYQGARRVRGDYEAGDL